MVPLSVCLCVCPAVHLYVSIYLSVCTCVCWPTGTENTYVLWILVQFYMRLDVVCLCVVFTRMCGIVIMFVRV